MNWSLKSEENLEVLNSRELQSPRTQRDIMARFLDVTKNSIQFSIPTIFSSLRDNGRAGNKLAACSVVAQTVREDTGLQARPWARYKVRTHLGPS